MKTPANLVKFFRTPLDDCFWVFSFVLLFFATQWSNRNQVFFIFEHEFCSSNFEIGKFPQTFKKTHRETPVQESLFQWSYMLEVYHFTEKSLKSLA